ncbi:MAG TPA: alpha/beta fold hydrolase [Sphingobium sp.]|uniref:epoxide hydrolase family protein n=1 Tax=Sphingobium sp. TaxID=1912891 RepID=UPI002ED212EB
MIIPFRIDVSQARVDHIRERVEQYNWDGLADAGGWKSGVGISDLRRLTSYWLDRYDWRAAEARLNKQPHFLTAVDGQDVHFLHAKGDGSRAPVILLHGWPGSFLEFKDIIAPLVADGHDVVVPSLPGYAFSGRPSSPIGSRRTAKLCNELMNRLFGAKRYLVQGGDWGSAVAAWLAQDFPERCLGLHLNMVMVQARDAIPSTQGELAWAEARQRTTADEMGYANEQGTRPQTLSVALADSPVGVAGWILEKFAAWSDVPRDAEGRPDLWSAFDEDFLLTNLMLYLATNSIVTSTWFYRGNVLEDSRRFDPGDRVTVPTAVAAFRDPVFLMLPRSLVEKSYHVVQWSDMPAGGHFAALEQPELLLADLRKFFDLIEYTGD